MDYASKIAPDTATFIRTSESFSALDASGGIEAQRRCFDDLCRHYARDHPPGITAEELTCGGVRIRRYRPEDPAAGRILYFHGGGFVVGSLDTHDSICADLAAATGMELTATDYRLAPEHRHPAALEDCLAVRDVMLSEDTRPVVLAGDSAGGWLAAMVAADSPGLIRGQVLIYPMLGAPMNAGSYRDHTNAPLLSAEAVGWYWEQYRGTVPADDEMQEPLGRDDLSGQPETHIIAAELDPLSDDGPLYAERLEQAGGKVFCHIATGLPHGFLRARHLSADVAKAWQQIISACLALNRD